MDDEELLSMKVLTVFILVFIAALFGAIFWLAGKTLGWW